MRARVPNKGGRRRLTDSDKVGRLRWLKEKARARVHADAVALAAAERGRRLEEMGVNQRRHLATAPCRPNSMRRTAPARPAARRSIDTETGKFPHAHNRPLACPHYAAPVAAIEADELEEMADAGDSGVAGDELEELDDAGIAGDDVQADEMDESTVLCEACDLRQRALHEDGSMRANCRRCFAPLSYWTLRLSPAAKRYLSEQQRQHRALSGLHMRRWRIMNVPSSLARPSIVRFPLCRRSIPMTGLCPGRDDGFSHQSASRLPRFRTERGRRVWGWACDRWMGEVDHDHQRPETSGFESCRTTKDLVSDSCTITNEP
jgi:hypothetical protein